MVALLTDFGLEGPYVGQVQAVLCRQAPGIRIINLFADLPPFRPRAAAYLVPAFITVFPPGSIFVVVVDPGVGSQRPAVVLRAGEYWFVGPDNGIFEIVCRRGDPVSVWEIPFDAAGTSPSFHGRDVFAPAAARLARGWSPQGAPRPALSSPRCDWPDDLFEIVYIDRFGNAMSGVRADLLDEEQVLVLGGRRIGFARVFSDAPPGEPFWYRNSAGLVEFALREGSIAAQLALAVGQAFSRAHPRMEEGGG